MGRAYVFGTGFSPEMRCAVAAVAAAFPRPMELDPCLDPLFSVCVVLPSTRPSGRERCPAWHNCFGPGWLCVEVISVHFQRAVEVNPTKRGPCSGPTVRLAGKRFPDASARRLISARYQKPYTTVGAHPERRGGCHFRHQGPRRPPRALFCAPKAVRPRSALVVECSANCSGRVVGGGGRDLGRGWAAGIGGGGGHERV